jgi:hypothetical protein
MKQNLKAYILFSAFASMLTLAYSSRSGQVHLAVDSQWYLESGRHLLAFNPDITNLIFSPLFSVFFLLQDKVSQFSLATPFDKIILVYIPSLLFSWGIWSCLLYFILPCLHHRQLWTFSNSLVLAIIVLVLFNPYLIKYSSPLFSDSFSLLGGALFALRYASPFLQKSNDRPDFSIFIKKSHLYYFILLVLCLFRYMNVILLLASLLNDFLPFTLRRTRLTALTSRLIPVFFGCILIATLVALIIAFKFFFGVNQTPHIGNLSNWLHYIQHLFMTLILNFGFREVFREAISNPKVLLDYAWFSAEFSKSGYETTFFEYLGSIVYPLFFLVGSIVSIVNIHKYSQQSFLPLLFPFLLLVVGELLLGVSHHRYFLMFMPTIIYGLTLMPAFRNHDSSKALQLQDLS